MNLNETMAFVAVVREGTFTGAGRHLGIPKSTVSRQVSRLEERMGTRLLHRTTRRVGLTEVGRRYYEHCASAIEAIEDANRIAEAASENPRGTLRVSLPMGASFLGALLPEFNHLYPDIHLVLVGAQRRVDLVAEGFDVALRGGKLSDSGLIARKLFDSSVILAASPAYLADHGTPRTLADLAEHRSVAYRRPGDTGSMRLHGPDGPVELPLRPWLTVNDTAVLRATLIAGGGIGIMVGELASADIHAGRLAQVLPEYALRGGGFYAVYPSARHLSPKVRAFVDFMVSRVPTLERLFLEGFQ